MISVTWLEYLSTRYAPMVTVDQLSEITTEHPVTIRKLVSKSTYAIPSLKIRSKRIKKPLIYWPQPCCACACAHPATPSKTASAFALASPANSA